jgi:hypothetical protein
VVQGFKSLGVPGFNAGGVVGGKILMHLVHLKLIWIY